jgi:hypothetical protein
MGTLELPILLICYKKLLPNYEFFYVVEVSGIEPLTSCMPCKRSPS